MAGHLSFLRVIHATGNSIRRRDVVLQRTCVHDLRKRATAFRLKPVSRAFFLLLDISVEQCSGVFIAENAHRCASPTRNPQEKALVDPGAAAIDKKHQHHDEKHTRYDSNKRYVVHGKSPCSFSG